MKIIVKYLEEDRDKDKIKTRNTIALYLFGIKLKRIKIARTIHGRKGIDSISNNIYMIIKQVLRASKNKKLLYLFNKIIKTIKIKKINLKLGLNFKDPIINSYAIALLNSTLPMYLAKQQIAQRNLKYETFIANKVIYIDTYLVIKVSTFRNIINLLKIIIIVLKENKKE